MTTWQRIDLLARAYPRLFPRAELVRLVRSQLGHVDALDAWVVRDGVRVRARAPKIIQHICAGNLAVSAWTSIAHGLLLGAHNIVKLPGEREDSTARREILEFIRGLPVALRKLVEVQRVSDGVAPTRAFPEGLWERGGAVLARADVVIAFGSDATMSTLRAQTRPDQKFIGHGHALSLLWIADPDRLTPRQARACAIDVLTYDQLAVFPRRRFMCPRARIWRRSDKSWPRRLNFPW